MSKVLTDDLIAEIQAVAYKGYYLRCVAGLFDVSIFAVWTAVRMPRKPLPEALPAERRGWRLSRAQRHIWR